MRRACQGPAWDGVTFADALDMATGNYDSALYEGDEDAAKTPRPVPAPRSCAARSPSPAGPIRATLGPGAVWVYHTSDTYLLGTAMNAYLKSLPGSAQADLFDDVVVADVFRPLGLSPVTYRPAAPMMRCASRSPAGA